MIDLLHYVPFLSAIFLWSVYIFNFFPNQIGDITSKLYNGVLILWLVYNLQYVNCTHVGCNTVSVVWRNIL